MPRVRVPFTSGSILVVIATKKQHQARYGIGWPPGYCWRLESEDSAYDAYEDWPVVARYATEAEEAIFRLAGNSLLSTVG
jgi:hypothetical protein